MLLVLLAQAVTPQAPAAPQEPVEIVVHARRAKCAVVLGGHDLSRAELDRYARKWAQGSPVQISAPDRASYRCLSKVLFQLSKRGVQTVEFIDTRPPKTPGR